MVRRLIASEYFRQLTLTRAFRALTRAVCTTRRPMLCGEWGNIRRYWSDTAEQRLHSFTWTFRLDASSFSSQYLPLVCTMYRVSYWNSSVEVVCLKYSVVISDWASRTITWHLVPQIGHACSVPWSEPSILDSPSECWNSRRSLGRYVRAGTGYCAENEGSSGGRAHCDGIRARLQFLIQQLKHAIFFINCKL